MSVSEFFSMGGFGLFVWSAMGITFLFFILEIIYLKRKRQTTMRRLQRLTSSNTGNNS